MTPQPTSQLPVQFIRYAVAIAIVTVGLAVTDNIDKRLGTLYLIVVLLGVAMAQREGVLRFTSFLAAQTKLAGG